MADATDGPDHDGDPHVDLTPTTGIPRWVKVFGLVVLALALLLIVLQLAGVGGDHGPGRLV